MGDSSAGPSVKMMTKEEVRNYCGFLCGPAQEAIEEVAADLAELKKVNPEFAEEFKTRLIDILKAV